MEWPDASPFPQAVRLSLLSHGVDNHLIQFIENHAPCLIITAEIADFLPTLNATSVEQTTHYLGACLNGINAILFLIARAYPDVAQPNSLSGHIIQRRVQSLSKLTDPCYKDTPLRSMIGLSVSKNQTLKPLTRLGRSRGRQHWGSSASTSTAL